MPWLTLPWEGSQETRYSLARKFAVVRNKGYKEGRMPLPALFGTGALNAKPGWQGGDAICLMHVLVF
eukprot:1161726-Pelagomonas_calceolata.AAC.4